MYRSGYPLSGQTDTKEAGQSGEQFVRTTSEQPQVTTKGVVSAPSKARGTVTENVDNGNKDYPIHHGDGTDAQAVASDDNAVLREQYSADARQFVTFTTKSGKTFHLIINHDEDSENVLLLMEVDEDDLLNMVEKKEEPKVVKEEPVQKVEETQSVKKEEPQPKSRMAKVSPKSRRRTKNCCKGICCFYTVKVL